MKKWLQLVASVATVAVASAKNSDVLVSSLPGLRKELSFKHYAGHIELQEKEKLFYWYAESQHDPTTDPIVLWLNGGPGCSSLGGLFTENGPFVVRDDLSIKVNRYSWNRNVNMVWLESPAGVGFSGSVQGPNYYNDDIVAAKTHEFVKLFFDKFSELKGREFFVTGESYAGMYIPYLVNLLVEKPITGVNFKGFAIGNPFTDNLIDGNAYMDYYYSHAMVSLESYEKMKVLCGAHIGCLFSDLPCPSECEQLLEEAETAANPDHLDPYFIYGDVCLLDNTQAKALRKRAKPSVQISPTHRGDIGACADTLTHLYLNLPEVQVAIHAIKRGGDPIAWKGCSDPVGDLYASSPSSLPKYRNILGRGIKALIYSGDADSVVNFIGTERWIGGEGLKLRITEKWRAWFGPDRQLAGYVQKYNGLTFKTVKGAGHMVPAVRPLHGLNLFECFVFGDGACKSFSYPVDDDEIESGLIVVQSIEEESRIKTNATDRAAVSSDESSPSTLWLSLPALLGVAMLLVAIAIRNGRKRANYQRLNSGGRTIRAVV